MSRGSILRRSLIVTCIVTCSVCSAVKEEPILTGVLDCIVVKDAIVKEEPSSPPKRPKLRETAIGQFCLEAPEGRVLPQPRLEPKDESLPRLAPEEEPHDLAAAIPAAAIANGCQERWQTQQLRHILELQLCRQNLLKEAIHKRKQDLDETEMHTKRLLEEQERDVEEQRRLQPLEEQAWRKLMELLETQRLGKVELKEARRLRKQELDEMEMHTKQLLEEQERDCEEQQRLEQSEEQVRRKLTELVAERTLQKLDLEEPRRQEEEVQQRMQRAQDKSMRIVEAQPKTEVAYEMSFEELADDGLGWSEDVTGSVQSTDRAINKFVSIDNILVRFRRHRERLTALGESDSCRRLDFRHPQQLDSAPDESWIRRVEPHPGAARGSDLLAGAHRQDLGAHQGVVDIGTRTAELHQHHAIPLVGARRDHVRVCIAGSGANHQPSSGHGAGARCRVSRSRARALPSVAGHDDDVDSVPHHGQHREHLQDSHRAGLATPALLRDGNPSHADSAHEPHHFHRSEQRSRTGFPG